MTFIVSIVLKTEIIAEILFFYYRTQNKHAFFPEITQACKEFEPLVQIKSNINMASGITIPSQIFCHRPQKTELGHVYK